MKNALSGIRVWSLFILLIGVTLHITHAAPTPASRLPSQKVPKLKTEPRCFMHFSEFCFGFNHDVIVDPFIEIKASCESRPGPVPRNVFAGYRLLILQAEPLAILFVVNFDLHEFPLTKEFIVIGSDNVENVDIRLSSGRVQSIFPKYSQNPSHMLFNPNENFYSLILLHGVPVNIAKKLQLEINADGTPMPKLLGQPEIAAIGQYSVDMVIFPFRNLNIPHQFDLFWKGKALPNNKAALPDIDRFSSSSGTLSMSVCEDSHKGFNGASFRSTTKSPGKKNICPVTFHTQEAKTYTDAACGPDTDHEIQPESQEIIHSLSPRSVIRYKESVFPTDSLRRCRQHFPLKEYILEKPEVQSWIRFGNNNCEFFCIMCKIYFEAGFRPDVKRRSAIAKSSYLSKDIYDNSDQIKKHMSNVVHLEAAQFGAKLIAADTEPKVTTAVQWAQNQEIKHFNATMNLLVFTYAEIKSGLSFLTHEELFKAINKMGVNIGCHHQNAVAAAYIADVFSTKFHSKLLKYLVDNEVPFSVIVDGSTNQNQAFLIVFIQTLEEGHTVTHFYCLLHLSNGETGLGMATIFINQIKSDEETYPGFENYFKSKLVSIVSDGASNMVAPKNSFKASIIQYLGKSIPNVVCFAHKLDNAIKMGLKPKAETLKKLKPQEHEEDAREWNKLLYFSNFEKTTNEFYSFYVSRGHKKWNHLLETAEHLQLLEPKKLKFFYAIRWSESHFNALHAIHYNYVALVEDLDSINKGRDFDQKAKQHSQKLFNRMTDKVYAIVLHEFLDLLAAFQIASKQLQQASANMIGKLPIVRRLTESLNNLRTTPGSFVNDFLQEISCPNICNLGGCNLIQFDNCETPKYKNIMLKQNPDILFRMSDERVTVYSNLLDGVNHYFDFNMLQQFEVFNAVNFGSLNEVRTATSISQLYSRDLTSSWFQTQLEQVCTFYNVNVENCRRFSEDWFPLLKCLLNNEGIQEMKTDKSEDFWTLALMQCSVHWSPISKEIVSKALVTPFSSAECERGFSVLNSIRTKTRSRMDKSTLNALIRVKLNGPNSQDLKVYEYTVAFLQKYVRSDDQEFCGGRTPDPGKLPPYFKNSRIY